jgi:divalent metal cation (Fe/Co/Zn/Cd) transporter
MMRVKLVTARRIGSTALKADAMNDSVDVLSGVIALTAFGLTIYDPGVSCV